MSIATSIIVTDSTAHVHEPKPLTGHVPSPLSPSTLAPASHIETPRQLGVIDDILRNRQRLIERICRQEDLSTLARSLIIAIAVASAIFGAALGTYRGDVQILYAAFKLPLLMLLTAAICAPTLTAWNAALDRPASLRRDLALILASLALGGLVLVAQAPLLLLCSSMNASYHAVILLTFGCSAVAGLSSLSLLVRGVKAISPTRATSVVAALVVVVCMVGAQMSWTLRPYIVRPRTPEVPFIRSVEGNLLESVLTSWQSMQGNYHRDFAPLPSQDRAAQPRAAE